MKKMKNFNIPAKYREEIEKLIRMLFESGDYHIDDSDRVFKLSSAGKKYCGSNRKDYKRVTLTLNREKYLPILANIIPTEDFSNSYPRVVMDEHRITTIVGGKSIPEGYVVDHKNEIKSDNSHDNLQVISRSENTRKGLIGKPRAKRFSLLISSDNTIVLPSELLDNLRVSSGQEVVLEYRGRTWSLGAH